MAAASVSICSYQCCCQGVIAIFKPRCYESLNWVVVVIKQTVVCTYQCDYFAVSYPPCSYQCNNYLFVWQFGCSAPCGGGAVRFSLHGCERFAFLEFGAVKIFMFCNIRI